MIKPSNVSPHVSLLTPNGCGAQQQLLFLPRSPIFSLPVSCEMRMEERQEGAFLLPCPLLFLPPPIKDPGDGPRKASSGLAEDSLARPWDIIESAQRAFPAGPFLPIMATGCGQFKADTGRGAARGREREIKMDLGADTSKFQRKREKTV